MERRAFLGLVAAAPLVYGLRELSAQDAPANPEWYGDALKRMKSRKVNGVVVVVPLQGRSRIAGEALWNLVGGANSEVHEIFTACVFICMTPALAEKAGLRKAGEKQERFLLDPDGKVLSSDPLPAAWLTDAATFCTSFHALLYGEKSEKLETLAAAARETLTQEMKDAFIKIDSDTLLVRENGSAVLVKHAATLHPLLIQMRRTAATDESRSRLSAVLESYYQTFDAEKPGPRLPFGTEIGDLTEDPCPTCGMGERPAKVGKFLKFLQQ